MFLGSALMLGGLWWAYDVRRRPAHTRAEFRGPAIMTGIGMLILMAYALFWFSLWTKPAD